MARKPKGQTLGPAYEFDSAYIWYNNKVYHPGDTLVAPAGATLTARAFVNNTNNTAGTACYYVKWGGQIRCWKKKYMDAGAWEELMPDCTFSMPSSDEDAVLECGSYEGGTCYYHDSAGTIHLKVKTTTKPCSVSTDEDAYYQGETVRIRYENAPENSTLSIGAYPSGTPGKSWTVSGSGPRSYTIPDDAPTGTWYVYLSGTNCSKTKYITVLASKTPTNLICKNPNKTATVGDTVDLEVKLEDKTTGAGINHKWIEFYKLVGSSEVSIGSCTTDPNGKCSITYTCSVEETATIKAKFRGDDGYKASECIFTITVSSKPTCNQSFRVVDEEDTNIRISNSVVIVREKGTAKELGRCTTDSNGECTVKDIEEGVWCVAEASAPSGYEVISDSSTEFVACTSLKTLKLRSTTCKQRVKVIDPSGKPIEGATVAIDMGTYSILCKKPDGSGYGTDANGECDLCNLDKGTVYTACASKEGYERYGSETCKLFKACSSLALILKLQKIPPAKLEIVEAFYSIDNGITFWGLKENSTIDLGDCKRPLFKLIIKNTGGLPSYQRCLWLRKGKGCASANTNTIEASTVTLDKDKLEIYIFRCAADMEYGEDYSFHIKNGQTIQGCPSDDELDFKTETRRPYEIRITVKDEKGHGIKHAYVSVTKEIFEGTWQEVPCSDITVHQGICTTESWNGYGNLLKTDDNGVLSIGLPSLPGAACRYGFIAGKPGYLNEDMHEDWTKPVTTRRQGENGEGTYEFEFTLKTAPKLIVHVTDVPTKGSCVYVYEKKLYIASSWWFPIPIATKTLETDGTVTFTVDDKIEVGGEYAVKAAGAAEKWPTWICLSTPPAKDEDWFIFETTIEKTIKGYYEAAPWQQWFCDLFDVSEEDCSAAWAELEVDLLFSPDSWRRVLEGKDINGNPASPRWYDYVFMVLDGIGLIPVGKLAGFFGRGGELAKAAAEDSKIIEWIKTIGKDKLARAIAGATDDDVKRLLSLLSNSRFDGASAWVDLFIAKPAQEPKSRVVKALTKSINTILKKAAKKGGDGLKIAEEGGAAAAHTKAASEIAADYADEIGKLRKFYKENVVFDDVVEMDRNLWLRLKDPELNKYLTNPIKGSEKIHPTGISLLDLWRVEALTKPGSVAKLKEAGRLDHFLEYAVKSIKADPGKFRKIVGALSDTEAATIVNELKAVHKPAEAYLYDALRTSDKWVKTGGLFDGISEVSSKLKVPTVAGGETHEAAKSIIDDSIEFIKAVEKDAKIAEDFEKSTSPDKIPRTLRLWNWIKNKAREAKLAWAEMTFKEKAKFYAKYILFPGCFGLFLAEEAMQTIGFGTIPAWHAIEGWEHKTVKEREEALDYLDDCLNARQAIHNLAFFSTVAFYPVCPVLAPIYYVYSRADAIAIETNKKMVENLRKDINPLTGEGKCRLAVRANVSGVHVYLDGIPTGKMAGVYPTYIEDVPVRSEEYTISVGGSKEGYLMDFQEVKITPYDIGKTIDVYLELTEESNVYTNVPETPGNPFSTPPPPSEEDLAKVPRPYGNADPQTWFSGNVGNINCKTTPVGAEIWLDGKNTGYKTNWTLTSIPAGRHTITFKLAGVEDCTVTADVIAGQTVQAFCDMTCPTPVASFSYAPSSPKAGESITFDASESRAGTRASLISYVWDFGDGTAGSGKIVKHTYTNDGSYIVKLTVTNSCGNKDTETKTITVYPVEQKMGYIDCYCTGDYCKRGADIYIDGELKGKTVSKPNYKRIKVPVGTHTIQYDLQGVMKCSGTVTVTADTSTTFDCELVSVLDPTQEGVTTTVTEIIDGDTIRTALTDALPDLPSGEKQRVRIVGYDAKETETELGKKAKAYLEKLIPVGTAITLKVWKHEPLDIYNRVLGGIFVGTKDIALEMLRSCLVDKSSYRGKFYWVDWDLYDKEWCSPTGVLTIATYDTITFTTPRNVATFLIDGHDKGGGYAVTATLPAGTHTVKVEGKEGEFVYCYANILDNCFSPCEFDVDVKKGETTVVQVCKAAYIYLSAYSGSDGYNINANFYYKPYDIPNATYKEIATGELIPFGRHYIKAVASGYETLEMIISVSDSGIECLYALSQGAVCYGSAPSTPGAHGLYSRNFIVKMYLKKAAVTKTVRFESVPGDATITVLD